MFNNFDTYGSKGEIISELRVLIKDPAEPLSSDPNEPEPAMVGKNTWKENPDPIITTEVRMINNLARNGKINNANCSKYDVMTPLAVVQEISIGDEEEGLKPDKLYTAVFNAVYKAPGDAQEDAAVVHSYVFKTSQYANFKEQVQSYILLRDENDLIEKEAVFQVEKTFDTEAINDASALLNGDFDLLISEYANLFDRLTDGILQLGVIPPAVTTDFNIIKESGTGRTIGIIIRNPEPFNDPKIPESHLSDTVELSVKAANGGLSSDYKVIFSQDKTQAFISNTELDIPAGTATFTFRYKQFSLYKVEEEGKEKIKVGYITKETEVVEIDM